MVCGLYSGPPCDRSCSHCLWHATRRPRTQMRPAGISTTVHGATRSSVARPASPTSSIPVSVGARANLAQPARTRTSRTAAIATVRRSAAAGGGRVRQTSRSRRPARSLHPLMPVYSIDRYGNVELVALTRANDAALEIAAAVDDPRHDGCLITDASWSACARRLLFAAQFTPRERRDERLQGGCGATTTRSRSWDASLRGACSTLGAADPPGA